VHCTLYQAAIAVQKLVGLPLKVDAQVWAMIPVGVNLATITDDKQRPAIGLESLRLTFLQIGTGTEWLKRHSGHHAYEKNRRLG